MYRNRTVEAMQREHAKALAARDRQIEQLLDRLMVLAGKPYGPTPYESSGPTAPDPWEGVVFPDQVVMEN